FAGYSGLADVGHLQHGSDHAVLKVGIGSLVLLTCLASWRGLGRRAVLLVMALALNTCSALLVALGHGLIEFHFHFFVVLAVVSFTRNGCRSWCRWPTWWPTTP